jgi:chromosome segregation ATPase
MGIAAAPTAWLPLQETAAEFRHECVALEQFVDKLLHDLDYLRLEIEHKADELEQTQRQLEERSRQLEEQRALSARLSEHLERQETQLDVALGELRELRTQLDAYKKDAVERDGGEAASASSDARPDWLSELDELRSQLSEAQSEISSAIQRASESGSSAAQGDSPSAEWVRERSELETELEVVRSRAAELQDIVDTQRRELGEARAEMSSELKELRRLVEQQASLLARNSGPMPTIPAPRDVEDPEAKDPPADDPVMNSVAAQFAKLQKDMALRRKKK